MATVATEHVAPKQPLNMPGFEHDTEPEPTPLKTLVHGVLQKYQKLLTTANFSAAFEEIHSRAFSPAEFGLLPEASSMAVILRSMPDVCAMISSHHHQGVSLPMLQLNMTHARHLIRDVLRRFAHQGVHSKTFSTEFLKVHGHLFSPDHFGLRKLKQLLKQMPDMVVIRPTREQGGFHIRYIERTNDVGVGVGGVGGSVRFSRTPPVRPQDHNQARRHRQRSVSMSELRLNSPDQSPQFRPRHLQAPTQTLPLSTSESVSPTTQSKNLTSPRMSPPLPVVQAPVRHSPLLSFVSAVSGGSPSRPSSHKRTISHHLLDTIIPQAPVPIPLIPQVPGILRRRRSLPSPRVDVDEEYDTLTFSLFANASPRSQVRSFQVGQPDSSLDSPGRDLCSQLAAESSQSPPLPARKLSLSQPLPFDGFDLNAAPKDKKVIGPSSARMVTGGSKSDKQTQEIVQDKKSLDPLFRVGEASIARSFPATLSIGFCHCHQTGCDQFCRTFQIGKKIIGFEGYAVTFLHDDTQHGRLSPSIIRTVLPPHLCGFVNSKGGSVLFGVDSSGQVKGCVVHKRDQLRDIQHALKGVTFDPPLASQQIRVVSHRVHLGVPIEHLRRRDSDPAFGLYVFEVSISRGNAADVYFVKDSDTRQEKAFIFKSRGLREVCGSGLRDLVQARVAKAFEGNLRKIEKEHMPNNTEAAIQMLQKSTAAELAKVASRMAQLDEVSPVNALRRFPMDAQTNFNEAHSQFRPGQHTHTTHQPSSAFAASATEARPWNTPTYFMD